MLVHNVFFWLQPDVTEQQRQAFAEGLTSLEHIGAVRELYAGAPAATEKREVVDDSFDYALTVLFDTQADHDAYQDDPVHLTFVEKFSPLWARVQVYDAE